MWCEWTPILDAMELSIETFTVPWGVNWAIFANYVYGTFT